MIVFSFLMAITAWITPGIYYVTKRNYNLTNPIIIFPIFVVFSLLVPFSETIFGWSGKFAFTSGLRQISTEINQQGGWAYIIANSYMIISAFFYFLGVYLVNGRLIPLNSDFIKLIPIKFSKIKVKYILFLILIPLITLPIIVFDSNSSGSYFLNQIFSLVNFFPALFLLFNFYAFLLCFLIAIPLAFLTLSKGNIFYLFLWSFMAYDFINYKIRFKKTFVIIIFLLGSSLISTMIEKRSELGFESLDTNLFYSFFYREYGFDAFAGDVYHSYNDDMINTRSYILGEFSEIIPSSVYEAFTGQKKVRMGSLVGVEVFRESKIAAAGVGFNRYFLTSFYHDLGLFGLIFISFLFGYLINSWFYRNLNKFKKSNNRIYLIRYLTICLNLHFFINGGIYYFLATFIIMNIMISIFKTTYQKVNFNLEKY